MSHGVHVGPSQRSLARHPAAASAGALLLAVALLCGVAGFAASGASRTAQSDAQAGVRSNRDAAVRALVHQADDFKTTVMTVATNTPVIDSLRTPTPSPALLRGVQDQLSTLARSKGSPSVFMTDRLGRLVALYPSQPELIGRNFAFRDWFKGVSRTGKPYVSQAYRTLAKGRPLVVAVATPVLDGSRRVGYLTVLWQLDSVRAVSQGARADDGVTITVTDQQGQPLTGTLRVDERGQAIQVPVDASTRQALAGRSLDAVSAGLLKAAGPVPGLGWTVTATLPSAVALAPARDFQRGLLITLGVALLLVLAFTMLTWRVARRRAAEQALAAENVRTLTAAQDLVHTMMVSAPIGIALADMDGRFQVVNNSLCELLGHNEEWFLAHRLQDVVHPDDADAAPQERSLVLSETRDSGVEKVRLIRADGTTVWVRRVAVYLRDEDGQATKLMVQAEDISAEHEAHEALTYLAFHDPLTGLHNRAWVLDILEVDLRAATRLGHSVAALYLDLDNFKVINDSLGHAAGDQVLTAVGERIAAALRPGDRVGRFGGDEFVIVIQDVHDDRDVVRCAERVSASISADLQVQGHRVVPSASIGVAVSTSTSTPDSLLRDADSALFRAKASGRGRWHVFDGTMPALAGGPTHAETPTA